MRWQMPGLETWAKAAWVVFWIAVVGGCCFAFAYYFPQILANVMPR